MTTLLEDNRVAFLFPGQGSQAVGMGKDLVEASPAARAVFEEAEDVLGLPLRRLCFEGPEEELTQTANAQPAIFTASVAYLKAAEERAGRQFTANPLYTAGHSLGEYTALVASGSLDFSPALRLVRERGRQMQMASERSPGGMAALIGLEEWVAEDICQQTGAQIANFNSADQVIISGSREAVARAVDLARVRGAKRAMPLRVGGAFHSVLMEPALRGLAEAVWSTPIRDPDIPVVANTTAEPMTSAQDLRKELIRQVCQCVRWQQSIEYMIKAGVGTFVEIGPGRVLTGLVKRISESVNAVSIADHPSLDDLAR